MRVHPQCTLWRRTCVGWAGLYLPERVYTYVSSMLACPKTTSFLPPPLPHLPSLSAPPSAALAFSHVLVGPRTLTTWESCMQVRTTSHTAVYRRQGSPVHDLHHAQGEFNLSHASKMPIAKTQQCLAYNVPPFRLLSPVTHRSTENSRGGPSDPSRQTVISRINAPAHGNIARASHSSLIPSPADRSWGCHSSMSNTRPPRDQRAPYPPLPPLPPPRRTQSECSHNMCAQSAFVAAVRIFFAWERTYITAALVGHPLRRGFGYGLR